MTIIINHDGDTVYSVPNKYHSASGCSPIFVFTLYSAQHTAVGK
jgi:hypothetical protein